MRKTLSHYLPLGLLPLLLAGAGISCTGEVGSGSGSASGPGGALPPGATPPGATAGTSGVPIGPDGMPIGPEPSDCSVPNVGPSPMRRLTHTEYNNAVADLLGVTAQPANSFPVETGVGLFNNTATTQSVPTLLAEGYLNSAAELAEGVDLPALVGCDVAAADCVASFIQRFGRRAFRRPLDPGEVERLAQVYESVRVEADDETAVRAVVASVLVAPQFLYHFEFGGQDSATPGIKQVAPFELAARLASLLWSSLPDDSLLDAAAAGQLSTEQQVLLQAERMLSDPRARAATNVFYQQWFGLKELDHAVKDAELFPEFNSELSESMRQETVRFVDHVIWEGDGTLATLLSAPYSFVDSRLAELYGLPVSGNAGFEQVSLDPAQRAGIVTHASFLSALSPAAETSPFKRGAWVRTRLLCQQLPAPPAEVPELPELEEGVSNRERARQHSSAPACASCHALIDGLGFGFEQYDAIGQFRTTDRGLPVDSSGEVTETSDINGTFNGGAELAGLLAQSAQVRDCAPTQWLRFALARPEVPADTCSLSQLKDSFAASGGNLKQLLLALTQTDAFMHYRRPD